MKKFFIGLFAGLVAVFGSIASVGSKSSFNNFNEFKMVQNAVVKTENNEYTFYLDSEVNQYDNYNQILLAQPRSYSKLYYVIEGSTDFIDFDLSSFVNDYFSSFPQDLEFTFVSTDRYNQFSLGSDSYDDGITLIEKSSSNNTWVIRDIDYNITNIIAFRLYDANVGNSAETMNSYLDDYIGTLTSLPSPPSPPSQNFLDDITSTINGVIDWFVDLFNGLTDIFINIDSNGNFLGFTLWGNVLFIEVAIMLVMIALRWVISLIRGI